jgi:two-component system LytT family response regulator
MSYKCLIIDDEPNAVKLLEVLVQQNTNWTLEGKFHNGARSLTFLKENYIDFVFLDINMPQLNGLELAGLIPLHTKIVFTTAYSEHAAESYTFQTIDYLLKPITLRRFLFAVQKIDQYYSKISSIGQAETFLFSTGFYFVKSGKMLQKIRMEDIHFFEAEKEYVKLVTATYSILLYRRLKDVEVQLILPFIRVHNSYIVNINHVVKMQDNHLFIMDKKIPISDKFRGAVMSVINRRIF